MPSTIRTRRECRPGFPRIFQRLRCDVLEKASLSQEALNSELRMTVRSRERPIDHVLWLVSRGADVNCADSLDYSPLLIALSTNPSANTVAMVSTLCKLCADVNYASDLFHGDTPLHFAAASQGQSGELISILLDHKANVNARNHAGRTPLHVAACHGNEAGVRMLYLGGAHLNAKEDYCGYSALHLAVIGSCYNTIEALLECGANITQLDACGLTSAERCQSADAKRLLLGATSRISTLEHLCLHAIRETVLRASVGLEGFKKLALPFTLKRKLIFFMENDYPMEP